MAQGNWPAFYNEQLRQGRCPHSGLKLTRDGEMGPEQPHVHSWSKPCPEHLVTLVYWCERHREFHTEED